MKKFVSLTMAILLVCSLLAGCGGASSAPSTPAAPAASQPDGSSAPAAPSGETYVLTFSTTMSQTAGDGVLNQVDYADLAMDEIEKRTNGAVTFSRTYSGTLGGEHDLGVMVTAGDLDIAVVGPGNWSDWDPAFKVFDCPFVFDTDDHYRKVLASDEYKAWMEAKGQEMGLVFLVTGYQGFKGIINNRRPIYSVDDLKGLKIRVPDSAPLIEVGNAMGYTPTVIAATDQYMSLSQGIIEGADHSLMAHCMWKLIELAPYFTETNHALQNTFIVGNREKLDSLPQEYRDIVIDTFAEYETIMNEAAIANNDIYREQAREAKVEIIPYDEVDVESFTTALSGLIKEYSSADQKLYDIIRKYA